MLGSNGYKKESGTPGPTTRDGRLGDAAKGGQGNRLGDRHDGRENWHGASNCAQEEDSKAGEERQEAVAAQGEKAGEKEAISALRGFASE